MITLCPNEDEMEGLTHNLPSEQNCLNQQLLWHYTHYHPLEVNFC